MADVSVQLYCMLYHTAEQQWHCWAVVCDGLHLGPWLLNEYLKLGKITRVVAFLYVNTCLSRHYTLLATFPRIWELFFYELQVLDRNFALGNIILPVSMILLQYCPSPQRYASDYQPPNYTLWYLEPHTRVSWLLALLVILYKVFYECVRCGFLFRDALLSETDLL